MQRLTDGWYVITTSSPEAVALYRRGVDLILRSSAEARSVLAAAVAVDGEMAVALAALAHQISEATEARRVLDDAVTSALAATRRERQHVEIVSAMLGGQVGRAVALGAEHLADFPRDAFVAHLLGR